MKISELKLILEEIDGVEFTLPDGKLVPNHFHVTEIGQIKKHFIDCGGTIRNESVINFQLFTANDYDHKLSAQKLKSIIELSERELSLEDLEIEVEYQSDTIGKYHLDYDGSRFILLETHTACLAKDNCNIPMEKTKIELANSSSENCCSPNSGCC